LCGIFGFLIGEDLRLSADELMDIVNRMFRLSESRGKEASGIAVKVKGEIYVFKQPISASKMVKSDKYRTLFEKVIKKKAQVEGHLNAPIVVIGHSRLQTNGPSEINSNNQPVVKSGAVGIHNGIIANDNELWESFEMLEKEYDVDTEVFLGLLQLFRKNGESLVEATSHVFSCMEGSASVAMLFDDIDTVLLATNTGSLYACASEKILIFASEKYILQRIVNLRKLRSLLDAKRIFQVKAREGYLVGMNSIDVHCFSFSHKVNGFATESLVGSHSDIVELNDRSAPLGRLGLGVQSLGEDVKQAMLQTWANLYTGEVELRRCTRCLLPVTMPFISFDAEGVCNYCRDYEGRGSYLKGEKAREEFVSKYR
jgi:glucosamine--fructose-6-phosphate aminotransferase (isomerizing)